MTTFIEQEEMERVSLQLYEYLCKYVVGSENIVSCRRMLFKALDDRTRKDFPKHNLKPISSGSKAEGLDISGSDYDVMILNSIYSVYEKGSDMKSCREITLFPEKITLIMETDICHPGFALLRFTNDFIHPHQYITNHGRFLSGMSMKKDLLFFGNSLGVSVKLNGPCITDMYDSLDLAVTLRCKTWPRIALPWATRSRFYSWPSDHVISQICKQGVLLVPVGSKSDTQEENPIEWRISFSASEKYLISCMNHTQFLCYALLKILIKDVVKKNKNFDKFICSYFLKTTILWLSEEHNIIWWRPKKLVRCFLSCIQRLIFFINDNNIPNYFIPNNNMINRKIPEHSRLELVSLLRTLHSMGWTCLLRCGTIEGFLNTSKVTFRSMEPSFTICEISLLRLYYHTIRMSPYDINKTSVIASFVEAQNQRYSVSTRVLYLFHMSLICRRVSHQTLPCNFRHTNKQQYLQQRQWLSYSLMGTSSDLISSWLLVALFFYKTNQHYQSLIILDYLQLNMKYLHSMKLDKFTIAFEGMERTSKDSNVLLLKLRCMRILNLDLYLTHERCAECNDTLFIFINVCPVNVLINYLMFLCYKDLKDHLRCQQSLNNLIMTVENDFGKLCLQDTTLSCMFISKAFSLLGDIFNAHKWQIIMNRLK